MVFGKTTSLITLFIFLFVTRLVSSQEISGVILDRNSKTPLAGASIYFDNTTLGTISNENGAFSLEYNPNIKTPLIVSFIGYKTLKFDTLDSSVTLKIYLDELEEALDEVLLTYDDGLTRALKLKEFRKHYLGESENGTSCEVLNEEDLILTYNPNKKQITARSKTPIFIQNNTLQYVVSVEIEHIELNYSYVSKNKKRLNFHDIYYSGAYFFKSLQKNPSSEIIEKREKAYNGSVLHFMRALSQNKLKESDYQMFYESFPINPKTKKHLNVMPMENSEGVFVNIKNKLSILYKKKLQSTIESLIDTFYIDHFGNHSPIDKIRFTGHMGDQRMGDVLPLNFLPLSYETEKELEKL